MIEKDILDQYEVNEEQFYAIDITKNIAVNAGAGSGKTRVLTARYLRLLKEGAADSVDNIVAITFTEKAALEMKERIRKLIDIEIQKSSDINLKNKWKKIKEDMENSHISTIHSFCDGIIRENYNLLGIDPNYSIIEDVDKGTVLDRITIEAINDIIYDENFSEALKYLIELYDTDFIVAGGLKDCLLSCYFKIKECGYDIEKAKEISKDVLNDFPGVDSIKDKISTLQQTIFAMIQKIHESYEKFKLEEGYLDFNDLEIYALKLLRNKEVSLYYKKRFKYFLVDEFQDINEIQKNIIYNLVCDDNNIEERKIFIVGDHKQSIYGFRGTDYKIFKEVSEKIKKNGEERFLSTCFRSQPNIINAVNEIFVHLLTPYESLKPSDENKNIEGKKVELISYIKQGSKCDDYWKDNKELLKKGSKEQVLEFLQNLIDNTKGELKFDIEAKILAKRIKKLTKEGFNYKDIAVLLRSRTNLSNFEDEFIKNDIPYCVLGGLGFFEKQEIIDIMNLYKILFDEKDYLSLFAVLRSPIFSISDSLIVIIIEKIINGIDIYTALSSIDCKDEENCIKRAALIINKLKNERYFYNAYDLLKRIIKETNYDEILLSQPNGFQKFRNLEKLLNIALEFVNKDIYSSKEFPAYIRVLENYSESSEALLDTEDSDAVKILTIHASKGLEFKAVIVPCMSKDLTYNIIYNKPKIYFDNNLGIVFLMKNDKNEYKPEANPIYNEFYKKACEREIEDSKRLLYVAATRAKEYLGFLGYEIDVKDNDILNSFMKQIKYGLKMCSKEDLIEKIDGKLLIDEKYDDESALKENKITVCDSYKKMLRWNYDIIPSIQSSISRYLLYKECNRKYFFQYIAGIKDTGNILKGLDLHEDINYKLDDNTDISASVKGTIIHRILEKMQNNKSCFDIEHEAEKIIKEFLDSNDFGFETVKFNIKKYIEGYFKIESSINNSLKKVKVETELSFRYPVLENSSIYINGVIDRIDIFKDKDSYKAYIIDYKSNRIDNIKRLNELAEYYKYQLMIYKRAVERLYRIDNRNVEVIGNYLYFLDCGEYRFFDFKDDEINLFLKEFSDAFSYIGTYDKLEDYSCNMSTHCENCDFNYICI
ncbi:hypothetical protein FDN13_09985 [Caloramator sp. E03]|uniref:UvrD-helicase domain-containing protein n=1 Tax=Caloramator sp. E03 TaxID=2576307 RepID=UPI0011107896|nr:UvrD-helicase domain-containing protein [Caloramator sp. E03]QCX34008.1 hypothetical protein FDN13_09985 [Caloramator sp. E03]